MSVTLFQVEVNQWPGFGSSLNYFSFTKRKKSQLPSAFNQLWLNIYIKSLFTTCCTSPIPWRIKKTMILGSNTITKLLFYCFLHRTGTHKHLQVRQQKYSICHFSLLRVHYAVTFCSNLWTYWHIIYSTAMKWGSLLLPASTHSWKTKHAKGKK